LNLDKGSENLPKKNLCSRLLLSPFTRQSNRKALREALEDKLSACICPEEKEKGLNRGARAESFLTCREHKSIFQIELNVNYLSYMSVG